MEASVSSGVGVLLAVLGICGILGAGYATFVSNKVRAELNFLKSSNDELRATIEHERRERALEKQSCDEKIVRLHEELVTLRGQIVTKLIDAVAEAAKKGFAIGAENEKEKQSDRIGKRERHTD